MKKTIALLTVFALLLSFSGCDITGQKYESEEAMQQAIVGDWVLESGDAYFNVDTAVIMFRDPQDDMEDIVFEYPDPVWSYKKGRIELEEGEFLVVEEGGGAILWNGNSRFVRKTIPEFVLYNAAMTGIYQNSMWSASFSQLCSNIARNVTATYYQEDEYSVDTFDMAALKETAKSCAGDIYYVTLTGEIVQNPDISYLYYQPAVFAEFAFVVANDEIKDGLYKVSSNFSTAALLFMIS